MASDQVSKGLAFLSYAREDVQIARRLCADLVRWGAAVWMDEVDLVGGEAWRPAIEDAIRRSSHFIALTSRHSVSKRGQVQSEVRVAIEVLRTLPPRQVFIVPVRLDVSKPEFDEINTLHWIDLFDDYEKGVARIAQSLGLSHLEDSDPLLRAQLMISKVFREASPVATEALLIGRAGELERLVQVHKASPGKSALVFGEPGVGKTSLVRVLERKTPSSFYRPMSRGDSFESVARAVAKHFFLDRTLPDHPSPADLARSLAEQSCLIILDDFEVLQLACREALSELILMLANHGSPSTLLLVGSASRWEELMPFPERVRRLLSLVALSPLSGDGLGDVLDQGFKLLSPVELAPEARDYLLQRSSDSLANLHKHAANSVYALLERVRAGDKEALLVEIGECEMGLAFDPGVG